MGQCHAPEIKAPTPKRPTSQPPIKPGPLPTGLACDAPTLIATPPPPLVTARLDTSQDREVMNWINQCSASTRDTDWIVPSSSSPQNDWSVDSSTNSVESTSSSLPARSEVTDPTGLDVNQHENHQRAVHAGTTTSGTGTPAEQSVRCEDTCQSDGHTLLEKAMSMDHDLRQEQMLTELAAEEHDQVAVARCIQSGWGDRRPNPARGVLSLHLDI